MGKTNRVRLTVPEQEDYLESAKIDALAIVCANVRLNVKNGTPVLDNQKVQTKQMLQNVLYHLRKYPETDRSGKILTAITPYVWKLLTEHYPTFDAYYEDLLMEGFLAVLEHADNYNESYTLTTYYKILLIHAWNGWINQNITGLTPYYVALQKKMQMFVSEYETMHGKEPSVHDIVIACGIRDKTVRLLIRMQTQSLRPIAIDQFDELVTLKKDYKAPSAEEEFIKSDAGSELIEYFKSVLKHSSYSELERETLKWMILDGKSAPEIARQLGLRPNNIKTAYKNGMWKLRPVMEAVI